MNHIFRIIQVYKLVNLSEIYVYHGRFADMRIFLITTRKAAAEYEKTITVLSRSAAYVSFQAFSLDL